MTSGTRFPAPVADVLRRALPDADLETPELLGEGWNATAWLVSDKLHGWVVRVPKLEWAAGEMERQTRLGAHLSALGLPVPHDWRLFRDAQGIIAAGAYSFVPGREATTRRRALDLLS